MRVVDLDRDMSDVIPTGMSLDSEYLFERMTEISISEALPDSGRRVLDVASGVGQDSIELAARGAWVVGAEPSRRMIGMSQLFAAEKAADKTKGSKGPAPGWVQAWSDSLPFATGAFDACICKGALDHFDRPEQAIAEMARVTRSSGRVVLAIANFESLACRAGRALDEMRQDLLGMEPLRERRGYDAPSDHFTRYEVDLMQEQASRHLVLEQVRGISVGWGLPGWSRLVEALPRELGWASLQGLDRLARAAPELADVIVLVGRPRRSPSTSA
ncbi:MAG: methyltransferase domain-containing protein [Deltaproteobacteria bacterium]|nr:methyltransferase domain-containing protein [Deltaproteobacteria bacterium]MBW2417711.1 methyltransferase domain-containing protein [Deltaproteobacteria bacterium]